MEMNNVMMNENNTTATTKEKKGILSIDKKFVMDFFAKASAEEQAWIIERMEFWMKDKGERAYFAPFRSEFASKFFPEMKSAKKVVKKPSLLEQLKAMRNA